MKQEVKSPLYAVVEFEVLRDNRLNSTDKVIYAIINTLTSNKDKICYAKTKYISNLLNLDQRTIKLSIAKLKKLNYIIVQVKNNNKRQIKTTVANFIDIRTKELDESKNLEYDDYNWLEE